MPKWDYLAQILTGANFADWGDHLRALGKDGWELVSVVNLEGIPYAFLKRPKQPASPN